MATLELTPQELELIQKRREEEARKAEEEAKKYTLRIQQRITEEENRITAALRRANTLSDKLSEDFDKILKKKYAGWKYQTDTRKETFYVRDYSKTDNPVVWQKEVTIPTAKIFKTALETEFVIAYDKYGGGLQISNIGNYKEYKNAVTCVEKVEEYIAKKRAEKERIDKGVHTKRLAQEQLPKLYPQATNFEFGYSVMYGELTVRMNLACGLKIDLRVPAVELNQTKIEPYMYEIMNTFYKDNRETSEALLQKLLKL